jgi:hypothetical protein
MREHVNQKRSRSEWEHLIARYEASHLAQRAFCTEHGVAYSSFCYWRKQLRSPEAVENRVAPLIELSALPSSEAPIWRIELDLGRGVVLRMR